MEARDLQGVKHVRLVGDLFDRWHSAGTLRDQAGHRELLFDQHALLRLTCLFNPVVDSLCGVRQLTTLDKVQRLCGATATSRGSLREAARVFDSRRLEPIIADLAQRAQAGSQALPPADQAALAGLTASDGSLLPAVSRMAWALRQDATPRAAQVHVAFAVFPEAPVGVRVTAGNANERQQWRQMAEPRCVRHESQWTRNLPLRRERSADWMRWS